MGKQKQGRAGRVNPEFKNLVRRLKRPPLTTDWHCIDVCKGPIPLIGLDTPKNGELPANHSAFVARLGSWWWVASDPAYILWTKYHQQYKAWCKVK